MKIGLLADIHANRQGFEACLEQVTRAGVDRVVLLGDYVGYGADPGWVVDRVRQLVAQGAVAVRGNHDDAVVRGPGDLMIDEARRVVAWTHEQLDTAQLAFLETLPLIHEDWGCLFVHANAFAPHEWEYITSRVEAVRSLHATDARYTFVGHMHGPRLFHLSTTAKIAEFVPTAGVTVPVPPHRQWLAIPGSCGQPRDGNPAACWALFDSGRAELTFHRVPYDVDTAAARIRAAGLPPRLAERLYEGN